MEDVAVANTQHGAAAAAHADVLDQLLALHGRRLDGLAARFAGDLRAMQEEFEGCGGGWGLKDEA